jgi:hypothetical protein
MSCHLKAALAMSLAACGAAASGPARAVAAQTTDAPLRRETLRPAANEFLEWAASVVQVDLLGDQRPRAITGSGDVTAKLFGAAGGDPAMNGLNTYLAFLASPDQGWVVFQLGDFLSYEIVSQGAGRVTLEVSESVMAHATGEIGSRTRRFTVTWTPSPDEAPTSVTVTPLS